MELRPHDKISSDEIVRALHGHPSGDVEMLMMCLAGVTPKTQLCMLLEGACIRDGQQASLQEEWLEEVAAKLSVMPLPSPSSWSPEQ